MINATVPEPIRFAEEVLGVRPRHVLPSVKIGEQTTRTERLVVTVHRRVVEGREAALKNALASTWLMPRAELNTVVGLLDEPGLVSWVHLGADGKRADSNIRKVYLELNEDAVARPDERWPRGTTHVAVKWAGAPKPVAVTAWYRRDATVPDAKPADLIATCLGPGPFAARATAILEELMAGGTEITEALDVTESGRAPRSLDLRLRASTGGPTSPTMSALLEERRVPHRILASIGPHGRGTLERVAFGRSGGGESFLTVYYTEPAPIGS